jgi:hypothetical protein
MATNPPAGTAPSAVRPAAAGPGGLNSADLWGEDPDALLVEQQISELDTSALQSRVRMFDNNIRVMKSEVNRLDHEVKGKQAQIKENLEKVKMVRCATGAHMGDVKRVVFFQI